MVDAPTEDEMPAAAVYDGAERVEDQNVRDLFIVTSTAVELWTLQPTIAEALEDLNDKLGLVRLAVGANQQLSGLSTRVRYIGCDEPDIVAPTASPCQASLQMQFEIERFEQHDTPYA